MQERVRSKTNAEIIQNIMQEAPRPLHRGGRVVLAQSLAKL
jgi:hypothetical protein